MTKTIISGTTQFKYEELEEERKSFGLTVFPSGQVVFKTPKKAPTAERQAFLLKKYPWVQRQQQFFKQFRPKSQCFTSGSDVLYLGRRYQLIVNTGKEEKISFAGSTLIIGGEKNVQALLIAFMKARAERVFAERLQVCLKLFPDYVGEKFSLKIRQMKKRWGSYLKGGTIALNIDLIKAPKRCIDYVILHELCHHRHKAHNKDFFALLEQKCPHYKALKIELERKVLG
ncbi:M48 family metallopeptidase [Candidatus Avelusimicrobium sp.]|uniref:M48 family metallopeptidase n=1 Tax=Candidatus Avelusimicrobium sp. TaxID=3048833 RepID=UPI003D7DDAAD